MQQQKKTSQPQLSKWRSLAPIFLGAVVVLVVVQKVSAGPITGGAGSAPFAKLSVYQGVLSIVPGGTNYMEIGNAGQDIASSGDMYIRPGALDTAAADYARFYKDASAANKVSLSIPGKLCLGGDCKAAWPAGVSGPIAHHSIGLLAADGTNAKRYEVARIGFDKNNWTNNGSVFVELYQKTWDAGGYKKYEVRAGYLDDGSFRLIEAIGSNVAGDVMQRVRLQIGTAVANGTCGVGLAPCLAYLPVYVDVDYYTQWDVIISHNMAETANAVPGASQLRVFDSPAATPAVGNFGNFTENDVVTQEFPVVASKQLINSQSFGATSGASVGVGSFAFLTPYLANGSYNAVTKLNDSGLFFSQDTGFTMGGWNTTGTKGIRLSGGAVANAALVVNNGLAGTGSAGDGLAAYANNLNSAVFGEQQNLNGYAGYFQNTVGGSAGWFQGAVHIYGPSTYDGFASGGTLTVRDTNPAAGSMAFRSESVTNGYAAYLTTNPASGTYPTLYSENKYSPGGFNIGKAAEFNGRVWFTSDNVDVSSYDSGAIDQYKRKFLFAGDSPNALTTFRNYGTGPSMQAVQNNSTALAGDFWGNVDINGNVKITGDLTYKGRIKSVPGLQVCEVGSDVCLGQYLYTTGTTRDATASGVRYFYDNGSVIMSQRVYITCSATANLKIRKPTGLSQYANPGCNSPEFVQGDNPVGFGSTEPFRVGDYVCVNSTNESFPAGSSRNASTAACINGTGIPRNGQRVADVLSGGSPFFELR